MSRIMSRLLVDEQYPVLCPVLLKPLEKQNNKHDMQLVLTTAVWVWVIDRKWLFGYLQETTVLRHEPMYW